MARTEGLTYICTTRREDAGPNNNWMDPSEAKERVGKLFDGCMQGRTMYVIPYLMGVPGSPHAKVGIEVTDIRYFASQSWAFPHSLMIAYNAEYAGGDLCPQESEIAEARWFAYDAVPDLPPSISISRRLIAATIERLAKEAV